MTGLPRGTRGRSVGGTSPELKLPSQRQGRTSQHGEATEQVGDLALHAGLCEGGGQTAGLGVTLEFTGPQQHPCPSALRLRIPQSPRSPLGRCAPAHLRWKGSPGSHQVRSTTVPAEVGIQMEWSGRLQDAPGLAPGSSVRSQTHDHCIT